MLDPETAKHRADMLVEEWKAISAYVAGAFGVIEKHGVYIISIVAIAAGVGAAAGERVPPEAWVFAAPALLVLLFRMLAQLNFSYFQAVRLIEIETKLRELAQHESDDGEYFQYGHTLHRLADELRERKAYAYEWWTLLTVALGLAIALYATSRGCLHLWNWSWQTAPHWLLAKGLALMYGVLMLAIGGILVKCLVGFREQFVHFRETQFQEQAPRPCGGADLPDDQTSSA